METIFIDRKNTQITVAQGRLKVKHPGMEGSYTSLPLTQMNALVISCDCQLTTGMLRSLSKFKVSLICLNNRNPDASMISVPMSNGNIARRVAQYQCISDDAQKSLFAQKLIRRKITLQLSMLRKLKSQRPDKATQFNRAISALQKLRLKTSTKLADATANMHTLMGYEGIAAKHYFSAFTEAFAPSLEFTGRNKRPPRDPVNAVLSLMYTMTYFEAIRACHGAGLAPYLGVLHQPDYNRASLACDIEELIRTQVDFWVYEMFRLRVLRSDHFCRENSGACMLTKAGRKVFFAQLAIAMPQWRKYLRSICAILAKTLVERDNTI
ncbi:CRISPR-associated endonuclease Cas1 [Thalassotalea ponticola]|uniref:CRISPR-associated endonuclease Cas1 n=1 Tax=Thalassotalea ponticola TaxID=1523392 RepID=UPI0025B3FAB5|nr:CRISPR-associated endonuclease Cas1 [Thalassotalea ponticola]MDN3651351.1 CRISPR-associated endonuclease Cas1 [Thalassotalea ponticola]